MSGIDRTSGHIGVSSSSQFKNTASQVGGAAFNVALTAGSTAAGVFGGPAAGNLVAAAGSSLRSGVAGGGSAGGSIANQVNASSADLKAELGQTNADGEISQREMLQLQRAINTESQLFNTITNTQKAKHDASMAAIQNTR